MSACAVEAQHNAKGVATVRLPYWPKVSRQVRLPFVFFVAHACTRDEPGDELMLRQMDRALRSFVRVVHVPVCINLYVCGERDG